MSQLEQIKTFLGNKNIPVATIHGEFTLCNASEIEEIEIKIYSFNIYDDHQYITPLGEDPNEFGIYKGKVINLMKSSEFYDPKGVLIYLPELDKIGSWNSSGYSLMVFTESFEEISQNLSKFIEAQWESMCGYDIYELFEPWKHWEFVANKR